MKIAKLSAFLTVFGSLLAGLLAGVYTLTIDKINENNLKATQEDLYVAFDQGTTFCNLTNDNAEYACDDTNVELLSGSIVAIYAALDGNQQIVGIVYQTSASNSFGSVEMLTALNLEGEVFGWVASESSSQTPGYGADLLKNGEFKKYVIESGRTDVTGGVTGTTNTVTEGVFEVQEHFNSNKGVLVK